MCSMAEKYYVLTRLAFGCRLSPKIFDTLAQAVCWIAINKYMYDVALALVYKTHWMSEKWPSKMLSIPDNLSSMASMELYPIVVAAYIFGKEWQTKKNNVHVW